MNFNNFASDFSINEADKVDSAEYLDEVFKQRALNLAQIPHSEEAGDQIQLLTLRLGCEFYAIEAAFIYDIRKVGEITHVPRVPDWIAGVVNVRGQIVSVIDLRGFFNLPADEPPAGARSASEAGPSHYQVLVKTTRMEVVLLVDEVISVASIPMRNIQKQHQILGELRPEYIRGTLPYIPQKEMAEGSVLMILDIEAILRDDRLIIEENVL